MWCTATSAIIHFQWACVFFPSFHIRINDSFHCVPLWCKLCLQSHLLELIPLVSLRLLDNLSLYNVQAPLNEEPLHWGKSYGHGCVARHFELHSLSHSLVFSMKGNFSLVVQIGLAVPFCFQFWYSFDKLQRGEILQGIFSKLTDLLFVMLSII